MIRIRTVLLAVLGAAAVAIGLASAAAPAAHHAAPAAHTTALAQPARQCQWIIGRSQWGSTWFQGRFSKNTCSTSRVIRGFIHCQDGRSERIWTGGWVHPAGKWSQAHCKIAGYTIKGGGVDVSGDGGSTYHRYWVTGDFPFQVPAAHYSGGVVAHTVAAVKRACKLAYRITTVTKNIFEIKFTQTCGISYRAWRRWGGNDYDLGTYRKCPGCVSEYSTACDISSCQSHPDGAPFCYGYQRKDTGAMTTLGGCSSRSLRRHRLDLAA